MLSRALAWLLGAVGAAACSGDLLHSTDWESRCQVARDANGCGGEPAATASSSSGGAGGESVSSSSHSASSAGGSLAGGAGGGGAGGEGPCQGCFDAVQNGVDATLPMCAGAQMALDALLVCICMACATPCATECMSGLKMGGATQECITCANDVAMQACADQVQACVAN